jgi:hypothetical protein
LTTADVQILDSIKHATGYEQTATEQAKDAGADFKRGAENFGQGAKDEFKAVSPFRTMSMHELMARSLTDYVMDLAPEPLHSAEVV